MGFLHFFRACIPKPLIYKGAVLANDLARILLNYLWILFALRFRRLGVPTKAPHRYAQDLAPPGPCCDKVHSGARYMKFG